MRHALRTLALCAVLVSTAALARAPMETSQLVDDTGTPIGTPSNPLNVVGSGGSGSATVTGSQEQDVRSSGTLNAATANAAITLPVNGQATVGLAFTGLAASGATVTFEQSNDGGTTWTGVNEVNAGTGVPSATRNTDGQTRVAVQGRTNLRVRVSTTGSGTITVASNISVREGLVTLASPLPPGANAIGSVLADLRVLGAANANGNPIFAQVTSGTVTLGAGSAQIGTVTQGPAATDTSANRWPTLAYQAGAWTTAAQIQGYYSGTLENLTGSQFTFFDIDKRRHMKISETGSDDPLVGIVPTVTQSGTNVLGKASQGNLYSAYVVNGTATAGYLACINAAAVPASGAAIAPLDVATLAGASGATASLNYAAGPPNAYSTGIVCLVTTSLTTYTPGGASFVQVRVR